MFNTRIGLRIPEEDRALLEKICKQQGEDISDFVRRAIKKEFAYLGCYTNEIKQALGLDASQEVEVSD